MSGGARGRPRSEAVRQAILESARDLLSELGYEHLTITAIAARSGSGRQTIYRWWHSKTRIIADLVLEGHVVLPAQDVPEGGTLEFDLINWLDTLLESLKDPSTAALVRALITAASEDEAEARLLYSMSTGPYHEGLVARLARGKRARQLRDDVDEIAIADALIGTVIFRVLTPGATPASPAAIVRSLVRA